MNKILTTLMLSLSAFVATTAMASPHHNAPAHERSAAATHWKHKDQKHWQDERRAKEQHFEQQRYLRNLNPSRDWRVGQQLPRMFEQAQYRLNGYESRHLPRSNKNQQWYKIKGDYVLVNERNNKIVRILG